MRKPGLKLRELNLIAAIRQALRGPLPDAAKVGQIAAIIEDYEQPAPVDAVDPSAADPGKPTTRV